MRAMISRHYRVFLGVIIGLLVSFQTTARAQANDAAAQAGQHFQAGKAAYAAGDLATALRELNAADALHGSSAIDYYLAVVHDRMGHGELATRFYRRYLEGAPDAPNRAAVEQRLQALQAPAANDMPPVPGSSAPPPAPPPAQSYPPPPASAPMASAPPAPQEDVRQIEATLHRSVTDEYQSYLSSSYRSQGRSFSDFLMQKARVRKYMGMGLTFGGVGMLVLGVAAGFGEFTAEGNVVGRDALGNSPATVAIIATFGSLGIACVAVGGYFWSHYGKEETSLKWYRHGQNLALSFDVGFDQRGGIARGILRF